MNDLNFFEPYIMPHKNKNIKSYLILGVITLVVLGAILYTLYLSYYIKTTQEGTDKINTIILSTETQNKMKIMNEKKEELKELQTNIKQLKALKNQLEERTIIDDILLENIASEMPTDVFLVDIIIEEQQIEIEASTENKRAIAQLEYNLRHTLYFEDIFIFGIVEEEGEFVFNATFRIKGVSRDEN